MGQKFYRTGIILYEHSAKRASSFFRYFSWKALWYKKNYLSLHPQTEKWCHSSVGRAKDWKSLCPRFDSWWHHFQRRNVAQLVAHYVRDVGVGRSSRLIPTKEKEINRLESQSVNLFFFIMPREIHRQYFRSNQTIIEIKKRGCVKIDTSSFFAQSPDFLKPGLCYFLKFL